MGDQSQILFLGLSAKDLISPVLVFVGLLLNGLYFNRKLESQKVATAVVSEDRKDTQKARKEAFFRLNNAASIGASAAKAILNSSRHPDRLAMIDQFLPSLTQLWASAKALDAENSNSNLSKDDVQPYRQLLKQLVDFFFMLDNNQMGQPEYVKRLAARHHEITALVASLPQHAGQRLKLGPLIE